MMTVHVTRASVHPGDDFDAPHEKRFSFPSNSPIEEMILKILDSGYLPAIMNGKATWVVASRLPLAVVAQEWAGPRMATPSIGPNHLDMQNEVLEMHFDYLGQQDPEHTLSKMRSDSANAT